LSDTVKAEGILGGMDNGKDVGRDLAPPTQHEEEEPPQSLRTRAATLPRIKSQAVKRRRLSNDTVASLDWFCVFNRKIEELKLEATLKIYENTKKLELEMFKLTQATQEMMVGFFASVLKARQSNVEM
jgi:hypothetical protein